MSDTAPAAVPAEQVEVVLPSDTFKDDGVLADDQTPTIPVDATP